MSDPSPESPAPLDSPLSLPEPSELVALKPNERLPLYKNYLKQEEAAIRSTHESGAPGVQTATSRAHLIDSVLQAIFRCACLMSADTSCPPIALVAVGGYGRAVLTPGSDIDLLFLLPKDSHALPQPAKDFVENILYPLWDLGFKVGHASRSVSECLAEAKRDPLNRTCLLDARLLIGKEDLFKELESHFFSACLEKQLDAFLGERREDIAHRHRKYSGTMFLQEPNVKESPGGIRDFNNLIWILYAHRGTHDLSTLLDEGILSANAHRELLEAFEFLLRVRSDLHIITGTASDILTLRLQGVIADRFLYPQENILRRIEAFMKDYYTHSKHVYQHTISIFEIFQIAIEDRYSESWKSRFLGGKSKDVEVFFSSFMSRSGRIYPTGDDIFSADPTLLMALFLENQKRSLRLSPPMRKLIKRNLPLVDDAFRASTEIKAYFRQIASQKGNVTRSLRQMHRVGFLGAYLPEFGALTCLVQHEFFHRYTADEHTLRCLDELDALFHSDHEDTRLYRKIYLEIDDPYALCIAMLMHDAGRAENVREHIDGSAILAAQVCDRLKIRGESRRLITFLVDHHLTLFRTATQMDTSDPRVIEDFAAQMKEVEYLDMLLVFTYADSRGTNEDGWTKWKESLILRLYHSARHFLLMNEHASEEFQTNKSALKVSVTSLTETGVSDAQIDEHFEMMPNSYFRYKHPRDVALHASAIAEFKTKQKINPDSFECCVSWVPYPKLGYSMIHLAAIDAPNLLERICHALASCEINILSADVYTRRDNIVLDVFRVTNKLDEAVTSEKKKTEVVDRIYEACQADGVSKRDLIVKKSILAGDGTGVTVPTNAWIDNVESPDYTVVSIQAVDRLGLLFEILREMRRANLSTARARICTENGVAMDSIYVTDSNGKKIVDEQVLQDLTDSLRQFITIPDPTVPE